MLLTTRLSAPAQAAARALGVYLPVAAVAVAVLESATDVFPDNGLISVITPLRLVIGAALIALVATGARASAFVTRIDVPIAVLLLVALAGTVLGHRSGAPFRELCTEVALFYLVVGFFRSRPEPSAPMSMLALVAVTIAGTVALAQISNQTPTGFCAGGLLGEGVCGHGDSAVRAIGTFANPNVLAAFLLLLAPLAALAPRLATERTTRLLLTGLAVVGFGAVLTTFSRAAYVAAFAGLLVIVVVRWILPRLNRNQIWLVVTGGAGALVALTVGLIALSRGGGSLYGRGSAWGTAIRVTESDPLFGVGLGRAGAVISANTTAGPFAHAHNLWLNWLVETGGAGFLAFTVITVAAVYCAVRLAARGRATGVAALAGLTGFFLMSLLDDPANLSRIAMAMWLVLGVVMAESQPRWRDPVVAPRPKAPPRTRTAQTGPKTRVVPRPRRAPVAAERTRPVLPPVEKPAEVTRPQRKAPTHPTPVPGLEAPRRRRPPQPPGEHPQPPAPRRTSGQHRLPDPPPRTEDERPEWPR
ncbi:O-antigen ligase [Amycolatopsis sp. GM8]|uniref:O-antigen ligase family protein n=1 Tax=Amycolatopsis sp. GM8 TaxID=2896530 RepID=UPI001F2211F9|nr:O-antigen ligase family protein [Amycolatopsis sp. GM8]